MLDIFTEIVQELTQGRDVTLATIVHQKGSAPRSLGTQFLVRPDGSFFGSIGGGRLEADVLAEASKVFSDKKNRTLCFRLKGEEVAETEMICGGEVDIYLELLSSQNPHHLEIFRKILSLQEKGQPGMLATLLEDGISAGRSDAKVLFLPEEEGGLEAVSWIAPVLERLPQILASNQVALLTALVKGEKKKIFLEPVKCPFHLCIFGAGHVSRYLCTLGRMVGFQVTVFDDRPEFASSLRFPEADEVVAQPFDQILKDYTFGPNDFIVIVTRGHLHDHQIVREVLKKPPRYIGMIGSRHKRDVIFKALKKEGFSEDQIRSVHAPIGLAINAETPEEIAVSITAELIQIRGQRKTKKEKSRL